MYLHMKKCKADITVVSTNSIMTVIFSHERIQTQNNNDLNQNRSF